MHVAINTGRLRGALKLADAAAAGAKSTRPILQCVRITAAGDDLTVEATNLERSVRVVLHTSVKEDGSAIVPCSKLRAIIEQQEHGDDEATVTLKTTDARLSVTCGKSRFQLVRVTGEEADTWPQLDPGAPVGTVACVDLAGALLTTGFATADEKMHYALNAVNLRRDGKLLHVNATDGRRAAWCDVPVDAPPDADVNLLVPTPAVSLWRAILADQAPDAPCTLLAGSGGDSGAAMGLCGIQAGEVTCTARQLEGHFPSIRTMKIANDPLAQIPREPFAHGLRAARVLTAVETRAVTLEFKNQHVDISAADPSSGECTVRVDLPEPASGKFSCHVNPDYLLDYLASVSADTLAFHGNDPGKAIQLVSGNHVYVLMPITA